MVFGLGLVHPFTLFSRIKNILLPATRQTAFTRPRLGLRRRLYQRESKKRKNDKRTRIFFFNKKKEKIWQHKSRNAQKKLTEVKEAHEMMITVFFFGIGIVIRGDSFVRMGSAQASHPGHLCGNVVIRWPAGSRRQFAREMTCNNTSSFSAKSRGHNQHDGRCNKKEKKTSGHDTLSN